jgi:hypothetical protein
MDAILIFLTSFGTAYLGRKLTRRGAFTPADFTIGLASGLIALSMARFLSTAFVEWGLGIPLILTCALSLGLGSLQRQPLRR